MSRNYYIFIYTKLFKTSIKYVFLMKNSYLLNILYFKNSFFHIEKYDDR